MDNLTKLRKRIGNVFKMSGFQLRSENSNMLAEHLLSLGESDYEHWLAMIIENLQTQRLQTSHVERADLERILHSIEHIGFDEGEIVFELINAFDIPRFVYNNRIKKFEKDARERSVLPQPASKSFYLRQRYEMLLQKTLRHELFAQSVVMDSVGSAGEVKKYKLSYAEKMLAASTAHEVVILGLLTQLKEGKFYVEDLTGSVELDLSETRYSSGFFCEGTFVLAEGSYDNKVLKVNGLGFPPAEIASSSRNFFGVHNSWGGSSDKLLKYSTRLQEIEHKKADATIVFLSDVRLDIPEVMERLKKLFLGYDSCPPVAIVLMGPFITASDRNFYALRKHFASLGKFLADCVELKRHTDLVLVPSGDDPIAPNILPRAPLPELLVADLKAAYPRCLLATNPCRLQYCTQQIAILRLDLMAKFCRNTLHFPSDTSNIEQHLARTLVCQNHLVPIHPIAVPIYWDFDSSLWLYPLPDLIVIGDSCQSFATTQHSCTILNTGSFVKSKFSFKVYIPATRTVEDSEIADEMMTE